MRDLQEDKLWVINVNHAYTESEIIAMHAIDRAITAEKERDELRTEVKRLLARISALEDGLE